MKGTQEIAQGPWAGREAFRMKEVAEILGVSLTKVKQLVRARRIGHIKIDRATRITRAQLTDFIRVQGS